MIGWRVCHLQNVNCLISNVWSIQNVEIFAIAAEIQGFVVCAIMEGLWWEPILVKFGGDTLPRNCVWLDPA